MRFLKFMGLFRPHQWYKNILIFLALLFSGNLFNFDLIFISFLGFLALILISSSNYILNDLVDFKRDRLNPEKKNRLIASGKISKGNSFFIFFCSLLFGLFLSFILNFEFFLICFGLFISSTLYSLWLKNVLFADLISISFNFVLRAVSGAILIGVPISPWLILGVFFLSMFLVSGKRYGELKYLKKKSIKHRSVLRDYSEDLLKSLFSIFLSILIMIFSFYAFFSENNYLFFTLPLFLFLILRYYYLILSEDKIIRNPEKIIYDLSFLLVALLFLILNVLFISFKNVN